MAKKVRYKLKEKKALPHVDGQRRKVSRTKVHNLLAQGYTKAQVAKELGCTRNTIYNIIKQHKMIQTKAITVGQKTSTALLGTSIDAMGQLNNVNEIIVAELDKVTHSLAVCDKSEEKGLRDAQIKYLQETRKQLKLLLEIYQTVHDISQVHKFQNVVLDVIRDIAPEARKEIIKRLRVEQFVNKELLI